MAFPWLTVQLLLAGVIATDAFDQRPRVEITASSVDATVRIDTTTATQVSTEPLVLPSSGESASVWVGVTSTITGVLRVSVVDATFDSLLAVYTDSVSTLRVVVANDDCASGGSAAFGTSGSCVKLYVTAGAVYAIQVSGFGAAKGLATLSLSMRT